MRSLLPAREQLLLRLQQQRVLLPLVPCLAPRTGARGVGCGKAAAALPIPEQSLAPRAGARGVDDRTQQCGELAGRSGHGQPELVIQGHFRGRRPGFGRRQEDQRQAPAGRGPARRGDEMHARGGAVHDQRDACGHLWPLRQIVRRHEQRRAVRGLHLPHAFCRRLGRTGDERHRQVMAEDVVAYPAQQLRHRLAIGRRAQDAAAQRRLLRDLRIIQQQQRGRPRQALRPGEPCRRRLPGQPGRSGHGDVRSAHAIGYFGQRRGFDKTEALARQALAQRDPQRWCQADRYQTYGFRCAGVRHIRSSFFS